jgi:hypothetical protein
MFDEADLIQSIQQSYDFIIENNNSTSPKRLNSLQSFVGNIIRENLREDVVVSFPNLQNVEGAYYRKKVPIVVSLEGDIKLCIGSKSILNGYGANIINHFQNLLGETANIQANGIMYANILFIPTRIPKNNSGGGIIEYERITEADLQKFVKLFSLQDFTHTPFATACIIIDINYEAETVQLTDLSTIFTPNFQQFYHENLSMSQFLAKIVEYCNNL